MLPNSPSYPGLMIKFPCRTRWTASASIGKVLLSNSLMLIFDKISISVPIVVNKLLYVFFTLWLPSFVSNISCKIISNGTKLVNGNVFFGFSPCFRSAIFIMRFITPNVIFFPQIGHIPLCFSLSSGRNLCWHFRCPSR